MSPRRRIPTPVKALAFAAVLVFALIGAGLWWFFDDDAPAEVNLQNAVEQVQDTTAPVSSSTTISAATDDGVSGTWAVDTETGDFDYETATGTFAGFRIAEKLSAIGSTTAVGRTGDVAGSVTIDGTTVTAGSFEVDLTTITTNESRRDDKVQSALETGTYPTATFTLTAPIDLGEAAASGEAVSVVATGDLTIHGVTKSVQLPLEAQLVNGTIVIVGSVDITFADYGVTVPKSQIVLSVDDHGTLEMQLLLTKTQ
jgi:polyisoprenoid-binding protein YceI